MSAARPFKSTGFSFGIYQIRSEIPGGEEPGMIRIESNGDIYRLAKAGATALAAGKLGVAAALNAAHIDEAITAAVAIGTKQLTLTITAGSAIAENQLVGGWFGINDGTGEGQIKRIIGNSALAVAGTEIVVTLAQGLDEALDATSNYTLIYNPYEAVIETTTLAKPVGVPLVDVTAEYYYWAKSRGIAMVLADGAVAVGLGVIQSDATAGAVETNAATSRVVGNVHGILSVTTEYYPIDLCID